MATWELSTEYKKSSIERQIWTKDGKVIIREEGYRWGTFTVESDEMPISHQDLIENEEYELSCIDNDECWELVDLSDGCWADTEAGRNCTDEDLAAFEEAWEENWYEGVEELGWSNDDTEYYMTGPLKLVNKDTGQEFSGLIDPTTIIHTIELPTEEVLPELAPIVDVKEGAQWPFTNPVANTKETAKWPFETEPVIEEEGPELTDWFPVKINPVRKGIYEILTVESINWPYPNKGEWTGKKWKFLDHTVTHWRGLAKDPGAK
jgi:hypothetical protein